MITCAIAEQTGGILFGMKRQNFNFLFNILLLPVSECNERRREGIADSREKVFSIWTSMTIIA
jgi:hypothetical protein